MLVRCLYASRAIAPQSRSVLDDILEQSRRNNLRLGITGLLCSTSDVFVQVVEGGRDEISALVCRIVRDERHRDVRLLSFEEIDERRFGNWTMGKVDMVAVNPALLLKHSKRAVLDPFAMTSKATLALMLELAATGAIASRTGYGATG
jgi:hypothetical protein